MSPVLGLLKWAPEEWLSAYLEHHLLIEFGVFSLLFVSLAWASLRHRLPGWPGRVAAMAVGLALSISLVLAMAHSELSLLDFAWLPLAVLATLALLAGARVLTHRHTGPISSSVALMVAASMVTAEILHDPSHGWIAWSRKILPWLGIGMVILMIRPSSRVTPAPGRRDGIQPGHELLEGAMARAVQQASSLGQRIQGIQQRASQTGADEATGAMIRQEVMRTRGLEALLERRLKQIVKVARQLEKQDTQGYGRLASGIQRSRTGVKRRLAAALTLRSAAVRTEDQVYHLAREAIRQVRRIDHCLSRSYRCLRATDPKRAERWMALALTHQNNLQRLLGELEQQESRLRIRLNNREGAPIRSRKNDIQP